MKNTGKLLAFMVPMLWIAGCASRTVAPPIAAVKIAGVLTVATAGKPTQRLRLVWERQEAGARDVVDIKDPWGGTRARIERDDSGAVLFAAGKSYQAADGAALAMRFLKVEMPVRALGHWLVGEPAPDTSAHVERHDDGRARIIVQYGWEVRYDEWDELGRPLLLRAHASGIVATLKINKWLSP